MAAHEGAIVLRPQPGAQERFLSTRADLAIYGGGAGSGKSFALLLEPLRHIANPRFGATIFRQTSTQIRAQGGLWSESATLYPFLGASPRETTLEWRFRSGARVKFAHLQHESDVYHWQGSQIALLAFDEVTHFSEQQVFYLLSRNRSTCGVRPYVRGTCNPDADSWLASFLAWWIDQDTGYPIPERSGVLRYMARKSGEIVWGESPADVASQVSGLDPAHVKSVTFVPARLSDNPALLAKDPGYLASLMALPLVERERLLGGNWKVRHSAGKIFNRAWFELVPAAPAGGRECRFWDLAATEKKLKGSDPDYTAGVRVRNVRGVYYVLDCIAAQQGPAAVDTLILNMARQDGASARAAGARAGVRWEMEGGASGPRDSLRLAQLLAGHDARGVRPRGDKVTRWKAFAAQAIAGNVKVVDGPWVASWLAHMHGQPDLPHDDVADASAGAFDEVAGVSEMGWS